MSYELRVTDYWFWVESLKARVEIRNCEFKFTSYEFKFTGYKFKYKSYGFKSRSYEFKYASSRIVWSMKNQVNSLKIFSFLKILSLKSFGNSWGKSSVQFLVIFVFYFSIISWLRFQQETVWVNINFGETYIQISY